MNDTNEPVERELHQARESVETLARQVDTEAAWDAVSAAVTRAPRERRTHRLQLAAVMVTVVAIVGAAVYARNGTPKQTNETTTPSTHRVTALADCDLPSLPIPGSGGSDSALALSGPAVTSLRGGAARTSFELGGGELAVSPPRPGDAPSVTAQQAECAALASSNADGWSLLESAATYGGAAVGYARVSIAPQLVAAADSSGPVGQIDHDTRPKLPAATPYQQRLAWVVVVRNVVITHGGPANVGSDHSATTAPASPASSNYNVFVVDAQTGTDALVYTENATGGSGGTLSVPAERVSVPWKLVSRSPNGYSGEITATVLPCDGVPNPVRVDTYRRAAAVVVQRPVGAECGAPMQVTLPIEAAEVTWNLPPEIAPDPLGPAVFLPEHPPAGGAYASECTQTPTYSCKHNGPDATGGVLRQVGHEATGTTIDVKRGSVLIVGPVQIGKVFAARPATTSDAAVLGMFPDSELHEFRAWRVGQADLYIPTATCDPAAGIGTPCTPPWILHVNITD